MTRTLRNLPCFLIRAWIQFMLGFTFLFLVTTSTQAQNDSLANAFSKNFIQLNSPPKQIDFFYQKVNEYGTNLSLDFIYKVLAWSKNEGIDSVSAHTHWIAAEALYFNKQLLDSAVSQSTQSLYIHIENNNKLRVAWTYFQMGYFYAQEHQYSLSTKNYLKALPIFQEINSIYGIYRTTRQLGIINAERKNFQQGYAYFLQALVASQTLGDSSYVFLTKTNLGYIISDSLRRKLNGEHRLFLTAGERKLLDSLSTPFLFQAYAIAKGLNNPNFMGMVTGHISSNFLLKNECDSALLYSRERLKINLSQNYTAQIPRSYNSIGFIFLNCHRLNGDKYSLDSSYQYLTQSRLLAEKKFDRNKLTLRRIYSNLQTLFSLKKEYDSAYIYLYQYDTLNQSIFNLEKEREIQDVKGRYTFEQQQRTIAQQEATLARTEAKIARRNLALGILLIITVSTTMIYLSNRARLRAKAQLAQNEIQLVEKRMEELVQQSELRTINALLEGQEKERERLSQELHDSVGSVLSAIKLHFTGLTGQFDAIQQEYRDSLEKGTTMLDTAVEEVRRISHNMTTGVLRKFGLVAALEDLQDTLLGTGQINFEIYVYGMDERLVGQLELNVYRVVQELVSNTLKHANASKITVEVNKRDTEFNVMVVDDGRGFDPNEVKSDGIGLQNMQKRVEKLGGNLHIDSAKGRGTTAVIDIPLSNEQTDYR